MELPISCITWIASDNKLGAIRTRYYLSVLIPMLVFSTRDVLDPEKTSRPVLNGLGRQGTWTNLA